MADTIDEKMHPPQEAKEEKHEKKNGTLESVIEELTGAAKAGANLGIGIAAPAAAYGFTGNAGVPVVSAAFVAGSGGSLTSKKFRNESIVGTIWGTMLHYFSLPLKYMSTLAKAAYVALLPFASNSIVATSDHLIKNKSSRGLYEKLKKNYWPNVKKTFKTIWPLNLFSALYFTQPAIIVGAIGVANYLFRKYIAKSPEEDVKDADKTPYLAAAPRVASKLFHNTAKGLTEAIYAFGKTFDSYMPATKTAPKQEAKPEAANPAPAHQ